MRVAYLCADPGVPVFGNKGCSIHVREVIDALRRAGADVELFASRFDGDRPAEWSDVLCHPLPACGKGDLAAREAACIAANDVVASLLYSRGPFDLVYERYSLWSHAAMEWARDRGVAGILEVNAPLIEEQSAHRGLADRNAAVAIAERTFTAASAVVAVSRPVAEYVTSVVPAAAVEVVPNGVDHHRFSPDVPPAAAVVPTDRFVVGFSGSMKPWHGLDDLVSAFRLVRREHDDAHLLLVGAGSELESIRSRIDALAMTEHVTFVGAIPSLRVPSMLTAMDVAVAPYPARDDFYFSPLKVVEYMAAGRAIAASRIGQIEVLLEQGESGLLCRPGDPRDLADAIGLLRDGDLRARLGREARRRVLRGHTWDDVASKILSLATGVRREVMA